MKKLRFGLVAAVALALLVALLPTATASASTDTRWRNDASGLCLATSQSAPEQPVVPNACSSTPVQYWDVNVVAYDVYGTPLQQIETHNPQYKCVVTRGTGESQAVATTCDFYYDQLWYVWHDTVIDRYQFQNFNSGLCLAMRGTAQAVQTTCGDWADQWWQQY